MINPSLVLLVVVATLSVPALGAARPESSPPMQVRIALSLTPYHKFAVRGQEDQPIYRRTETQKYTLRAALDRSNHFYFKNWHIVTRPVYWAKQTRDYKTQLTIYQRFGKDYKIEEKIGSIEAAGTLKPYPKLYILQNFQKKTFQDNSGNPRLLVVTGFTLDHQNVATSKYKHRKTN